MLSANMLETISTYMEAHQLLPQSGRLVVAVSGGADSLCLLHLLHRLCGEGKRYPHISLHVAHLNHQLRGEASRQDADEVARIATLWGLTVTIGTEDVPALARREQRSLEDAARVARYRFLRAVAQGDLIAVAHHMDDQVETLILHWLRGGGLASMVGLQPRQDDIIRPLLAVTHADTLAYCEEHHIVPLEDASNLDPRFLRNRIRHELLPLLEAMNPGIRATLLRTSEIMQVDSAWIEAQIDACWPTVVSSVQDERIVLKRDALLSLPLSLQRHLLRRVTARLNSGQSPLELRHYKLIEQLLQRTSSIGTGETFTLHLPQHIHALVIGEEVSFTVADQKSTSQPLTTAERVTVTLLIPGQVTIPGTGWLATAERITGQLLREVQTALRQEDWVRVWRLLSATRYSVYIDGGRVGDTLLVRTRRPGDRLRPLGMAHEKKVQDILVDSHIARTERERLPLFFADEHCIWLGGVCIDDQYRLTTSTQEIVHLSINPSPIET
jgi:tRNA(Ile)-lysidine synthase